MSPRGGNAKHGRTPRTQAAIAGRATYIGNPCRYGHTGPRYTNSVTCARDRAAAVARCWRERAPS